MVDVVVIGGGLAGCSLAWQCRLRGLRTLVVDEPRTDSSSRVAAGLVTPITGSRHAVSWRWNEFFPVADSFYQQIENKTGRVFWHIAPALRAFESSHEAERWAQRWSADESTYRSLGVCARALLCQQVPESWSPWGGIEMEPAARLDTRAYLNATRDVFQSDGLWIQTRLDVDHELVPTANTLRISKIGLEARWVALCQGFWSRTNRWFENLPLHPARGDILEVASPSLHLHHVFHRNGWIAPLDGDRYLLGATYDRYALETSPMHSSADHWRRELCLRWEQMTGESMEHGETKILEHRIGVRPASYDRHPLIGSHPKHRNLLCLNGLGSKGSLMAPFLAERILEWILDGTPIESPLLWNRRILS